MGSSKQLNGPKGPLYDPLGRVAVGGTGATVSMTPGSGISAGAGTLYRSLVTRQGAFIKTEIFIDLTGLNSSTAGDIIGVNSAANCHLGQITAAVNGTLFKGSYWCLEVPATGEPDIDVFYADEATGTEDAAVTGLTGDTAMKEAAADFTAVGQGFQFITVPPADKYIYLVGSGGGDAATYTAGQFVIELWGYPV
jgi:hypothetical protein